MITIINLGNSKNKKMNEYNNIYPCTSDNCNKI